MAKEPSITQIRARLRQIGAKEKAKVLRHYAPFARKIDLRKKLSGKQLRKIEAAFSEYTDLTSRPHVVFRPRKKANLKAAQAFSQHETKSPFNVAFVPTADINAKIKVSKSGKVTIRNKFVTQGFSAFNTRRLVIDAEKEIRRAMAEHPKAERFIIKTGEYHYNGPMPREKIVEMGLKFVERYAPGGDKFKEYAGGSSNHFENWLIGLETYTYANQDDLDDYMIERERQRRETLREKKNERQRYRRTFGERVNVFKRK